MRTAVLLVALGAAVAQAQIVGDTMQCFTLTKRTTFQLTGVKQRTAAVCVNLLSGEVLGALLSRTGARFCDVRGYLVSLNCADVVVCSTRRTICL